MEKLDQISSALRKILHTKESANGESTKTNHNMNKDSIAKNKIQILKEKLLKGKIKN